MYDRELPGHIITSLEELTHCQSLFDEWQSRRAGPEREKEIAVALCAATGIRFPIEAWSRNSLRIECDIRLNLNASRNAFVVKEKGIVIGSEIVCGSLKAKAVVEKIHWSYDLIVSHLDPARKQKIRRWDPKNVELSSESFPQPVIAHLTSQTLVLEKNANSWSAYFDFDPTTRGFGRSESEAVGSLYVKNIGTAILKNPQLFGLTIITKPA